ncbi:MAG: sensor histidine kinase, partial [Chromatiales bacterium]|nr:sensor histidine kinase [Chromatiales bacterium]
IARELHDELGQSLTALKIDISWLKMKVPSIDTAIYEKLKSVDDLLDSTVDSLRHIYEDLRPGMLDDLGLVSAAEYQITKFIEQSGISCEFSVNQTEIEVPKKVAINLFRILQESLTNIIRHASAGNVKVILHDLKNEILLIIEDDGRGIKMLSNCEDSRKRYGILGMQERVHVLGGKIDFISEQGEGTRIEISVPINSEVAA